MSPLTLDALKAEAKAFLQQLTASAIPSLYGVTDGKKIGTLVEREFNRYLQTRYTYVLGNAASGVDFPELAVDLKVTSINKPQSSSPFVEPGQKVYGLGYSLLVFVYRKQDDPTTSTTTLTFPQAIFVPSEHTADYRITNGLHEMLERGTSREEVMRYLLKQGLRLDEVPLGELADRILGEPPPMGRLTVSNALQWRLQYGSTIKRLNTGEQDVENILD